MSIFAGILRINSDSPIEQSLCDDLINVVNRNSDNKVYTYNGKGVFLCNIDIGAFPDLGMVVDDDSVLFLAGDPLLEVRGASNRLDDLVVMRRKADLDDWSFLRGARGTYCLCHYNIKGNRLNLITDKIGVRPLYYWFDGKTVVFSTIFRVFKDMLKNSLQIDLEGLVQEIAFGYQLGERTAFKDVLRIDSATRVQIDSSTVLKNRYWTFTGNPPSTKQQSDCKELHKTFMHAVEIRLRGASHANSFLSGGLDSRCVVGALSQKGILVDTFNFSRANTLDQVLADDFAKKIGSNHFEQTIGEDHRGCDIPAYFNNCRKKLGRGNVHGSDRCGAVWSGDGGSVGMGHEYLTQDMVDLLKKGQINDAVSMYLELCKIIIPRSLLNKNIYYLFKDLPYISSMLEVNKVNTFDNARIIYNFLINNDQKRHLDHYYEEIDNHRIELILPFYDSEFISLISSMPIDDFLYHKLYVQWLDFFPSPVKEVPWQAYRGHVPCPLPLPENVRGQWDSNDKEKRKARVERGLVLAEKTLRSESFPKHLLSRRNLSLAKFMMKFGVGDYSYLHESASVLCKYFDENISEY